MPRVWNPTEEKVETKIFGNYFTFAPGQMRNISNPEIANFIGSRRLETGLVVLPAQFDPMDEEHFVEGYDKTPEGKAILAEKKAEGIRNLIAYHTQIVYNNQVSLKKDWAKRDPSNDPAKLAMIDASPGEIESMRLVAKYNKLKLNEQDKKAAEVEKLMGEIGPLQGK